MSKTKAAFDFDSGLYSAFRKVAKERGRKMTWYLEGCMREVVKSRRRPDRKPKKTKEVVPGAV